LLERSGAYTEAEFAFSILRGSPSGNEDDQNVTFFVDVLQGSAALFQPRSWGCNQSSLVAICADGLLNLEVAPLTHGTATLSVRMQDSGGTDNGGVDTSDVHTFTVTVVPVNNRPSFDARNLTVWENFDNASGAHVMPGFATNVFAGSMLEAGQNMTFTVDVPRQFGCLFARRSDTAERGGLPVISANGTLSFELAAHVHGSFEMFVTLRDDGGREQGGIDTSETKLFTVTILPVNNQPSFKLDKSEIVVHEGEGNVSVSGVLSAISAGPSRGGENAQLLHLSVALASGNESMFVLRHWRCPAHPAPQSLSSSPLPTTPAPGHNVSDNSNNTANVTLPPLFCPEDEQPVLASVFNDENYADLARWRLCWSGEFLFELVPYANGEATFETTLRDSGGTDRGGVNTSVLHVLRAIVLPVNSRPSFTAPAQVNVSEDSGNYSQPFIDSIFRGASDENAQTVTFSAVLVHGNAGLFVPRNWRCLGATGHAGDELALGRICPGGELRFEVAHDAEGEAIFNVTMQDSGGRERGGVDTSEAHALRIIVSAVNDQPSFELLPVIQAWEQTSSARYVMPDIAYAISAGPANEQNQTMSFSVALYPGTNYSLISQNCNPACGNETECQSHGQETCFEYCIRVFGHTRQQLDDCRVRRCYMPKIHDNGTLTFTVPAFVFGVAELIVTVRDSGGTAGEGVDQSTVRRLRIVVNATNNAPSFNVTNVSLLEDAGSVSVAGFVHSILKNGAPCAPLNDEAAQNMSFAVFVQRGAHLFKRVGSLDDTWLFAPPADLSLFSLQGNNSNNSAPFTESLAPFPRNWTSLGERGLLYVTSHGVLSFDLAADQVGEALVAVVARDNGGTQGGRGEDTSVVRYASVRVEPVNDAPSFELLQGDCLSMVPWCSDVIPTIMMRRNRFVDGHGYFKSGFARNVSTGPPDEMGQTYTFNVRKVSGQDILSGVPTLHSSGALNATQNTGVSGMAFFNISVTDSGGNRSGGVDTSMDSSVRFLTLGGSVHVHLTLNVSAASLTLEFRIQFVRQIAATINYTHDLIGLSFPGASDNSRRLLSASVNVTVTIFATTIDPVQLADIASRLSLLSNINGVVAVGSATVSLVDESPIYAFALMQSTIEVDEDTGDYEQSFFATNVTASDAVDIDQNGQRIVTFDVQVVSSTESTTGSHLVSALFASQPVIDSIPCGTSQPCGGTLKFTLRPERFGEAHFIVSMRNTGLSRSFSIRVQGVNDVPTFAVAKPSITLNSIHEQSPRLIRVPGVLTSISAGAAEDDVQTVKINVSVVSSRGPLYWPDSETWPSDNSSGLSNSTSRRRLLSFSAAPGAPVVDDHMRLFFESFSFNASDGSLEMLLQPTVFGSIELGVQISDSDGGVSSMHNLSIDIEFVNHAPSFSVASAVVSILEDCAGANNGHCDNTTFVYANFVTNMSAGPANEGAQQMTIAGVVVVECQVPFRAGGMWQSTSNQALASNGCPKDLSFPGMTAGFEHLTSSPFMITQDGTLSVTLVADRHGAVRLAISVSDNGGTARGGIDAATLQVLVDVVSVNDAPSVSFSPALLNLTLNEGCRNHVPERPYPTGWTWTQDAQACRSWRGISFQGCWVPLYVCTYSPVWDEAPRVESQVNSSLLGCPATCSARVEGEVVLADANLQVVLMNQAAFQLAVTQALRPISVSVDDVNVTAIFNITLPYQKPAVRALLAEEESEGVVVMFSIANIDSDKSNIATNSNSLCAQQCLTNQNDTCACLLPSCLQQCASSSLKELLESAHNATIFPTAAVTRLRVRSSDDAHDESPAACVNPLPPPRVQCQDGRFVVHGHIFDIEPGAWGEEDQQIWFTVQQRSGPELGKLQIALPLYNVTDQAVVIFEPNAERYGIINFYVTVHDSGGTTNGGIDATTYWSDTHPIELKIIGFNRRPSFELEDRLYVEQDSACVQAGDGLPCDASCQEGQDLCVGGALPGSPCGPQTLCAGNCSAGQPIPVSLSCTGTCSCDEFGNGVCSSPGLCRCDAPNTRAVCYSSADCTGGGSCQNLGTCSYPSDTGAPCTLSSQCSNRGKCVLRMAAHRRHQRYDLAYNISAGAPFEFWQGLSFSVTPENATLAARLFVPQPSGELVSMAADGMLAFNLTRGAFGSHTFTLQLSDDSGDESTRLSEIRRLQILVSPKNSPPDFEIPENITVFEDSGLYDQIAVLDIFSPNAVGTGLAVSFKLDTLEPQLFLPHGQPRIESTGSVSTRRLIFEAAPDMFGTCKVVFTMTDLSRQEAGLISVTKEMLIIVQPVNDAPRFDLLRVFVSGPVNSPRQRLQVATNISIGPVNEQCKKAGSWGCQYQNASFIVEDMSHPFIFAEFPSIDARSGDLVYRVAPDTSGVSTVSIRLMDNGPLNDDAAFAACADYSETSFSTDLTSVAPEYRGNGANVQCLRDSGIYRGGNTSKLVTIVIQVVHGPPIEEVRLLYNVNTTSMPSLQTLACPPLTLPYPALLDDAVLINDLGLEVEADLSHGALLCSVLPGATYDLGDGVERPNALVLLALNQGITISSFAVIVREGTYIPASVAVFRRVGDGIDRDQDNQVDSPGGSAAAASLKFLDRRQSPQRITRGLEYATALIPSPDHLHVYATEPELDSISVWNVHQDEPWASNGPAGVKRTNGTLDALGMQGWPDERSVSFVERRAHGENRIRFRGMNSSDPLKHDRVPKAVYTPDMICHIEPFDNTPRGQGSESLQLLGMAGGCQDTSLDHVLMANETRNYVPPTSRFRVLGRWDFSSSSLYGDHYVDPAAMDPFGSLEWAEYYGADTLPTEWRCQGKPCQGAFEATGNVTCTPTRGCSYSRGSVQVPDCKEPASDLHIYPATIADSGGGTLGALVFTGPKCRSHATVHDWLLAPRPYNIINFLVNDGKHEAMQFDGLMNSGLFLTNDLRRFVNKDPAKSKLPSREMAVEAWVTVDAQEAMTGGIMSAAVSASDGTCSKGWRLFYELSKGDNEPLDLLFKFEISLEGNDAFGTGAMKLIEVPVTLSQDLIDNCGSALGLKAAASSRGVTPIHYNCFSGYWFHVVATYDGSALYMQVSHQVDADMPITEKKVERACSSPPCGNIVYPTDYHPLDDQPTTKCTTYGPVPVVVGNFTGREPQSSPKEASSHIGLIKQVALYKGYMTPQQADAHMLLHQDLLNTRPHWQRYWGKANGISPSINMINVEDAGKAYSPNVTLHGLFLTNRYYRCRWTSRTSLQDVSYLSTPLKLPTVETVGTPIPFKCRYAKVQNSLVQPADCTGTDDCHMATCLDVPDSLELTPDSISLTCPTPEWAHGMQSVVLTLAEGYIDPDISESRIQWSTLWQKACFSADCGYKFYRARLLRGSAHTWMYVSLHDLTKPATGVPCALANDTKDASTTACGSGAMVVSPAVHGTITHFYMTATSTVWTFDLEGSEWRGEAPFSVERVTRGSNYLASMLVLSSAVKPLDAYAFEPYSTLMRFDVSPEDGGVGDLHRIRNGFGLLPGGRFPAFPGGPALDARPVFPAGCAENDGLPDDPDAWCNHTVQEGAVTAITYIAGANTTNCSQDGVLTATFASGMQVRAKYRAQGSWWILPEFSFATPQDRGYNLTMGADFTMTSSDGWCNCSTPGQESVADMSQCFHLHIASGATFALKADGGMQKAWRLAPSRWGTLGLLDCDKVVGCRQDDMAAGHYGASSMRALAHQPSGGSMLFVSNYHDGLVREVNSTVWYTQADTGRPTMVQQIPTAGATDVELFSVLPVNANCVDGNNCPAPDASSEPGAPQMVVFANYHGPSAVYRWSGGLPVVAARIDTAGINYPDSGRVVAISVDGQRVLVGSFEAQMGDMVRVSISSNASFLPGVRLQAEYHTDRNCPLGDKACDAAPITGSVVNVSTRLNTFFYCGENSTTGILIAAGGLRVRIEKQGDAERSAWHAHIENASGHGSGYSRVQDIVVDPGKCFCNLNHSTVLATSANVNSSSGLETNLSMHLCLHFTLAYHGDVLTPLPHGEGAPGITDILVANPGQGYGRGEVRAVGDAGGRGTGFRAVVHASAGGGVMPEWGGYYTGGITRGLVHANGHGYLPDTRLDIFYGPHCALNDAGCSNVRMEGSVTAVQQQWGPEAGVIKCTAGGTITAKPHAQGGHGFIAQFDLLPSGGIAVWFLNSKDHGAGYPGGVGSLHPVVSNESGCVCDRMEYDPVEQNMTRVVNRDVRACLQLVVAHGARLEPVPQRLMRPAYCYDPGTGRTADVSPDTCRDVTNRKVLHPWHSQQIATQVAGVDMTRPWWLPTEHAVALAPLTLWGESFLVVACYAPGQVSNSKVFRLVSVLGNTSTPAGESYASMDVEEVQTIRTQDAREVDVFHDPWTGDALVLFAFRGTRGSELYRWRTRSRHSFRLAQLPMLELVQTVATRQPNRIFSIFKAGTVYVTIAQQEPEHWSLVLRWNGTQLLGLVDTSTLPKDAAGGQIVPSSGGRVLVMWEDKGESWLLAANGFNTSALRPTTPDQCNIQHYPGDSPCGYTVLGALAPCYGGGAGACEGVPAAGSIHRSEVFSSLYRVSHMEAKRPLDMKRPCALVVSPDGRFVYVAASLSQSINGFMRELPYGELEWRPEACYSINVADPTHDAEFESPWPEREEDSLRRPLEGLSGLAISKDGTALLATAAFENALYVFHRNVTGGELTFVQVIRDQDRLADGRIIDGLGGAGAVAVAQRRVYVTSFEDHSVSVFDLGNVECNGTCAAGNLSSNLTKALDLCVSDCVIRHGPVEAAYDKCVENCKPYQTATYVDRLKERERLIDRFPTRARLDIANESWSQSSEPRRLGGARLPWANRSRSSVSFRVDGQLFLAVAASDGDADGTGTLGIFKWIETNMTFELHQTLSRESNPSDVEFIEQLPLSGDDASLSKNLLLVSNFGRKGGAGASGSAMPISVYMFHRNTGKFLLYQGLTLAMPDGSLLPPFLTQSPPLARCPRGPLRRPRAFSLVQQAGGTLGYCPKEAATSNSTSSTNSTFNFTSAITANATNATNATSAAGTPPPPPSPPPPPPVNYVFSSDFLQVPAYGCVPEPLVQSLKVWNQGYTTYLAAALIWDQPSEEQYKWYSVVWRWNRDGFALLENGEQVEGFGFQMFQTIPTNAATDVEVLRVPATSPSAQETVLVIFSNLLHSTNKDDFHAQSAVYRFSEGVWNPLIRATAGYLELVQSLDTVGAVALKGMVVSDKYVVLEDGQVLEDDMYLLGIASMQASANDLPSLPSQIYRWDPELGRLVLHQELALNNSISGMELVQEGRERHLVLTALTHVACDNVTANAVTANVSLPAPINSTVVSATSNSTANATSNSTANVTSAAVYSTGHTVTVLQWDRVTKKFDRLMALTDTDSIATTGSPVAAEERRIHDAALILQLQDTVHAHVVTVSPDLMLLAISSVSTGVMMFDWRFSRVSGLAGASALVLDADGTRAFVSGAGSRALAFVASESITDSVGRNVRELTWYEAWSQDKIRVDRLRNTHYERVEGLAGVVKLELHPPNCSFSPPPANSSNGANTTWYTPCLTLAAHAQPPRYNLPCGPIPPVPVTDLALVNGGIPEWFVAARCSEASISPAAVALSTLGMTPYMSENPAIFTRPPELSSKGVFDVEPTPDAYGDAAFAMLLTNESGHVQGQPMPPARVVHFAVLPVRIIPSFEPVDVTVNEDVEGQVLKFATKIDSGNPFTGQQALLNYKWKIVGNITCQPFPASRLFTRPPSDDGMTTYLMNDETAYAAVRFQFALHENGVCAVTVKIYDSTAPEWESVAKTFRIVARPVNDPPHVEVAAELSVDQGVGRITLPRTIRCLSWSPDAMPLECDAPVHVNGSQGMCVPARDSPLESAFGPDCGGLETLGRSGYLADATRGPYCKPVAIVEYGRTVRYEQQGPCWFSMALVKVEKVQQQGPPWPAEADRQLLDAPSALLYALLDMDSLVVEMDPLQFGLFCITLAFSDRGGTEGGGHDTTIRKLWLRVNQRVLPPEISIPDAGGGEGDNLGEDATADAGLEEDFELAQLSKLNLIVIEMKHTLPQHYPDFLPAISNGSPEQQSVTTLTTSIVQLSSSHLFLGGSSNLAGAFPGTFDDQLCGVCVPTVCDGCPVLGMDGRPGSLSFTLAPYRYGVSSMLVKLESVSLLSSGNFSRAVTSYRFDLVVLPVNDPPSAAVTSFLGLAQGLTTVEIPFFVTNITVGPENEVWQEAVFHVYSQSDTPNLLTRMPKIDSKGTLSLALWPQVHGRIHLRIVLSDTGGSENGGRNVSAHFPVESEIKVYPSPVIVSVSPCLGTARGGWRITIRGNYFGSAYSTDGQGHEVFPAQVGADVEVKVGEHVCSNTTFLSDTMLQCDVPAGGMRRSVTVTVGGGQSLNKQGRLLSDWSGRQATYVDGVVHAHVYFGGAAGPSGARTGSGYRWAPWPPGEKTSPEKSSPGAPATAPAHNCSGNTTSGNATANCTATDTDTDAAPPGSSPPPEPAAEDVHGYWQQANASNATDPNGTASPWWRAPGGAWLDGGGQGGFMAVSPSMDCPKSENLISSGFSAAEECPLAAWNGAEQWVPATVSSLSCLSAHVLSRSVRAMQVFGPYLFLGGSFLGHTNNAYDYVLQWDGAKVQPLGGGLDGTVYALNTFRGQLVVGGSFSQLFQVSFLPRPYLV